MGLFLTWPVSYLEIFVDTGGLMKSSNMRARSKKRAQSPVQKTIESLRLDSEQREDGALIGYEDELLSRYGVSRPTLRQAARLVQQEQLIAVRRGAAGGYYASRPMVSAVAHMASIYLRSRGAGTKDMIHVIELVRRDMVRMAALHPDEGDKTALRDFLVEDEAAQTGGYGYRQFVAAERAYSHLLGALAGSEVLHLFLQILLDLMVWSDKRREVVPQYSPDRLVTACRRRGRVIRAILEGDAEVAMLEVDRGIRQLMEWRATDMLID